MIFLWKENVYSYSLYSYKKVCSEIRRNFDKRMANIFKRRVTVWMSGIQMTSFTVALCEKIIYPVSTSVVPKLSKYSTWWSPTSSFFYSRSCGAGWFQIERSR